MHGRRIGVETRSLVTVRQCTLSLSSAPTVAGRRGNVRSGRRVSFVEDRRGVAYPPPVHGSCRPQAGREGQRRAEKPSTSVPLPPPLPRRDRTPDTDTSPGDAGRRGLARAHIPRHPWPRPRGYCPAGVSWGPTALHSRQGRVLTLGHGRGECRKVRKQSARPIPSQRVPALHPGNTSTLSY